MFACVRTCLRVCVCVCACVRVCVLLCTADSFLCRSLADDDRCETPDSDYCFPTRSASGMVMDLIGNVGANPGPLALFPTFETPSTPPTPGSASSERGYVLNGEGPGAKSKDVPAIRRRRMMQNKSKSVTHTPIRKELYNIQDNLIPFAQGGVVSLSEEMNSLNDGGLLELVSEHSESECKSPDIELLSKSVGTAVRSWDGFFTLQRRPKTLKPDLSKRRTLMPKKSKSIDITPPASEPGARFGARSRRGEGRPRGDGAGDGKAWKRTTAIRRKKRSPSSPGGPAIPEMSYSFQVCKGFEPDQLNHTIVQNTLAVLFATKPFSLSHSPSLETT